MGDHVTHDDEGGGATADLYCVRCGYHLRGLAEDGTCPECGTAVTRSMRGDLLSAADPAWLRRVYRGQLYIGIGCAVFLLRIPLDILFGVLGLGAFPFVRKAVVVLGFLSLAFVLVGVTWVTTLDPRLSLTEQPVGLRRITRGAAIGALGLASLRSGMRLSGGEGLWVPPIVSSMLSWSGLVLLVFIVVAVTFYFSRLAERIPDPEQARRIWLRARNAGICFVVAFVVTAIAPEDFPEQSGVVGWLAAVFTVASVFYALALIGTWWAFRKDFKRYLVEASARLPGRLER